MVGYDPHFLLSALCGGVSVGICGSLLPAVRRLAASTFRVLLFGAVAGCVLWVIDLRTIAQPLFPHCTRVSHFRNGFIPHTGFFGLALWEYIAALRPSRSP